MKAGHDRPDRYACYLGNFAIAERVQLAQHDRLASQRRKRLDQLVETLQIGPAFEQHLRIARSRRDSVAEFRLGFERDNMSRPVALEPAVAGAPYDLEQPALSIAVAIRVEIAKRPQASLLHDIGGIGIVARQPSRERVGGVEMGQRYRLKPVALTAIRVPRDVP